MVVVGGGGGGNNGKNNNESESAAAVYRKLPMWKHCLRAIYAGTLSFFWGSYEATVVTAGGKINLLGLMAFMMMLLAIYTANLAAILTSQTQVLEVSTIQQAIQENHNFCMDRGKFFCFVFLWLVLL